MLDVFSAYGREYVMEDTMKEQIDGMSAYDIGVAIRFLPDCNMLFKGDNYDYMMARFKELGGFTVELSKQIGWDAKEALSK